MKLKQVLRVLFDAFCQVLSFHDFFADDFLLRLASISKSNQVDSMYVWISVMFGAILSSLEQSTFHCLVFAMVFLAFVLNVKFVVSDDVASLIEHDGCMQMVVAIVVLLLTDDELLDSTAR